VSDHGQWITAWRRIVEIYRAAGADNVHFVWCPIAEDDAGTEEMEKYWPGSEWVDVLGFDAYNWGSPWRSHQEIFGDAYRRVTALDPVKPVWVCEFASAEGSGEQSKGRWVEALMGDTGFPRIQALNWFSVDKECAWHMNSSPEALAAFATAWRA
jgi:beta-mannanase